MNYFGYGMMGGYGYGGSIWMTLSWGIWLIAGILVIVWLWQHIDKK